MKPSSRGGEADEAIQAFLCGPWIAHMGMIVVKRAKRCRLLTMGLLLCPTAAF
jgi:hypothetical protein